MFLNSGVREFLSQDKEKEDWRSGKSATKRMGEKKDQKQIKKS